MIENVVILTSWNILLEQLGGGTNTINNTTLTLTSMIMGLALLIAGIASLIMFLKMVWLNALDRGTITDNKELIDQEKVVSWFVTVVMIILYPVWIALLYGAINIGIEITQASDENMILMQEMYGTMLAGSNPTTIKEEEEVVLAIIQNYGKDGYENITKQMYNKANAMAKEHELDVTKTVSPDILKEKVAFVDSEKAEMNFWQEVTFLLSRIGQVILDSFMSLIASVVRTLVITLAQITWKITIIFGPLALAFNIFFPGTFQRWMGIFLNVGFALIVINIIDHMLVAWNYSMWNTKETVDSLGEVLFTFVTVILYSMPFKIASWFVGKSDSSAIASKSIMMGSAAVAMIAPGVGSAVVGGASKLAGKVAGVAKAGSRATADSGDGDSGDGK